MIAIFGKGKNSMKAIFIATLALFTVSAPYGALSQVKVAETVNARPGGCPEGPPCPKPKKHDQIDSEAARPGGGHVHRSPSDNEYGRSKKEQFPSYKVPPNVSKQPRNESQNRRSEN